MGKGLIVAMDTGGSKTRLNLYECTGALLAEAYGVGMGAGSNDEVQACLLTEVLDRLMEGFDCRQVAFVIGNVGGVNDKQLQEVLSVYFSNAKVEVYRESSGVLMKALCQAKKVDVLLMAGTGVIALANGEKGSMITDGWSPYLGDAGSGFWIGLHAVQYALRALENTGQLSLLARTLTGRSKPFSPVEDTRLQMRFRDEVRAQYMPIDRKKIAGLVPIVAECARNGDETAKQIFYEAGMMLAETTQRGIVLSECKEPIRILSWITGYGRYK